MFVSSPRPLGEVAGEPVSLTERAVAAIAIFALSLASRELPPRGSLEVTAHWKASSVRQSRLSRLSVCHLLQREKASNNCLPEITIFCYFPSVRKRRKPSPLGLVQSSNRQMAKFGAELADRVSRWFFWKRVGLRSFAFILSPKPHINHNPQLRGLSRGRRFPRERGHRI